MNVSVNFDACPLITFNVPPRGKMRARSSPRSKSSHLSGELRVPLLLGALPLLLSSTPLHMDPQIYYPTQ